MCHGLEQDLILGNDGEENAEPLVLPFDVLRYSVCLSSSLLSGQTKAERRNRFINNPDLVLILQ